MSGRLPYALCCNHFLSAVRFLINLLIYIDQYNLFRHQKSLVTITRTRALLHTHVHFQCIFVISHSKTLTGITSPLGSITTILQKEVGRTTHSFPLVKTWNPDDKLNFMHSKLCLPSRYNKRYAYTIQLPYKK